MKSAISIHGGDNVKKAVDIALERDKPIMIYINGILKRYLKGGENNGNKSPFKNNGSGANEFAGFKPQQPRTITEEELI